MKMNGAVILNGISRHKRKFYDQILPPLAARFSIKVFETEFAGHAQILAAEISQQSFDFVLAAGGDGTLNQVLNGLLQHKTSTIPSFGIIPLGTGNDFAKTCGVKAGDNSLIRLLDRNQPKLTDIGCLHCVDESGAAMTRYFINCCSLGMGPDVVRRLAATDRSLGPSLTYIKAIISTFFNLSTQFMRCQSGDWSWEGHVRVLGISNGKSFGNSIYLAPDASQDDGIFDVLIAREMPVIKFLYLLALLKMRRKINNPSVIYRRITSIDISADSAHPIETEGELAGYLPANVKVIPKKIHFFR